MGKGLRNLTLDLKLGLVKLQLPLLVTQLFGQIFILKEPNNNDSLSD